MTGLLASADNFGDYLQTRQQRASLFAYDDKPRADEPAEMFGIYPTTDVATVIGIASDDLVCRLDGLLSALGAIPRRSRYFQQRNNGSRGWGTNWCNPLC